MFLCFNLSTSSVLTMVLSWESIRSAVHFSGDRYESQRDSDLTSHGSLIDDSKAIQWIVLI